MSLFTEAELNDLEAEEFDRSLYIVDEHYLASVARSIKRAGRVAFDIETTGLGIDCELVGLGLAWFDRDPDKKQEVLCSVYIPVGHITMKPQLRLDVVKPYLQDIFDNVIVDVFNLGFEAKVMARFGVLIPKANDVRFMAVAADEANCKRGLKDLGEEILGMKWGSIKELCSRKVKERNEKGRLVTKTIQDIAGTSIEKLGKYCRIDCEVTAKLQRHFAPKSFYAAGILKLEHQVCPVVAEMEERGIQVDIPKVHEALERLTKELEDLQYVIFQAAGRTFNVNSNPQVADVLFNTLGLPRFRENCVDVNTMRFLEDKHMVPKLLLQYREREKIRGTYLVPLLEKSINGRIYTSLNQLGAESGRFSSSGPYTC